MIDQLYLQEVMSAPLVIKKDHRLPFSGAKNFRDLGGYRSQDGRTVRWGLLYRSDALNKMTSTDLKLLSTLGLYLIMDFRADHEREHEPDRLPEEMSGRLVEIPILDSSTKIWHDSRDEFVKNMKNIDPAKYMTQTNKELAIRFVHQMRHFIGKLLSADGRPILFHCAVGKDRTGFAAAILLRILGIPQEVVMQDYLLTNQYIMPAQQRNMVILRLMKGKVFADAVKGFMEARPEYLAAAFDAIDSEYGSFDAYVYKGLALSTDQIESLKKLYLE
jgi:protein-tyrosine phosphatase